LVFEAGVGPSRWASIPTRFRVIVKYLGGGFGSKAWSHRITYYAAKLSMMTEDR